jgi:hypothetical protein
MTPSHSRKQGLRYRYYVSSALIQGQPELVGSVTRVPAAEIESLVCNAVAQHANEPAAYVRELVRNHVARVDVTATAITVTIDPIPRLEGRLPHGIGVARMLELPPGWARQYEILGLVPPA